jgi:hypothetical protein
MESCKNIGYMVLSHKLYNANYKSNFDTVCAFQFSGIGNCFPGEGGIMTETWRKIHLFSYTHPYFYNFANKIFQISIRSIL